MPRRKDPHHRQHAGPEGRRDEIGRRKGFALAVVIERGVCQKLDLGRTMCGGAAQLSAINNVDLNAHIKVI